MIDFKESQETPALLRILALGRAQVEAGEVDPLSEAIASLRRSLKEKQEARR